MSDPKSVSMSDLYITVCYISYDGISGDTDTVYFSKAEAEQAAAARMSEAESCTLGVKLQYSAMSLYDYMQARVEEARLRAKAENDFV